MKRRGLASPDIADALALTYARPVFPRVYDDWMGTGDGLVVSEYDPLSEDAMEGRPHRPARRRPPPPRGRMGDLAPTAGGRVNNKKKHGPLMFVKGANCDAR